VDIAIYKPGKDGALLGHDTCSIGFVTSLPCCRVLLLYNPATMNFYTCLNMVKATDSDRVCAEHWKWFSVTFQDCLIEWLSNKSHFHIHLLSAT